MPADRWLPRDTELEGNLKLQELLYDGILYQIYAVTGKGRHVLIAREDLAKSWVDAGLLARALLVPYKFGAETFSCLTSDQRALAPLSQCPSLESDSEAIAFAAALQRTRSIVGRNRSLSEAIYVEKYSLLLPTPTIEQELPDDVVLGRYLTGGIEVSCNNKRRLKSLVPGLSDDKLNKIISAAAIGQKTIDESPLAAASARKQEPSAKKSFSLVGRPQLEAFFRDHVIDIVEHPERYKPMGIDFPSAIVLHGPPGCGKTYAVERLVEYLDWPIFTIDSGSIGSKYIHETSRKVSDMFQKAMEQNPSVVVIDEMEAFLADRESGGEHRIEEVAEFLRRIPEAISHNVLIIAMTNRIDLIDPAIIRRGRFDHVISVGMATTEEVTPLLDRLFAEKPHAGDIDIRAAAEKLTGRPLSDVSFFVREAARLTAKAAKQQIDREAVAAAMSAVFDREPETKKPRMGFV